MIQFIDRLKKFFFSPQTIIKLAVKTSSDEEYVGVELSKTLPERIKNLSKEELFADLKNNWKQTTDKLINEITPILQKQFPSTISDVIILGVTKFN